MRSVPGTFDQPFKYMDFVRQAGMKVCSGGIVGSGESSQDRIGLLHELATLAIHPELRIHQYVGAD